LETGAQSPEELLYIKFSGGRDPGDVISLPNVAELVEGAEQKLAARIVDFDRDDKPYHAQVAPVVTRQPGDYGHLERLREWSAGAWDSGE
jgi:hypothetical protein